MPARRLGLLTAVLAAALLCACSAKHRPGLDGLSQPAASTPEPGPASAFPAPADLPRQGSALTEDYLRFREGSDYEAVPAAHNVAQEANSVHFVSTGSAAQLQNLDDAAYCIYRAFELDEIPGAPTVSLLWSQAPAQGQDCYLGLANFDQNAWDWFNLKDSFVVDTGGFAPYLRDDGTLFAAVVLLGGAEGILDYVLLGQTAVQSGYMSSNFNPATPADFQAPCTLQFSCWVKLVGTSITGYDWDFEGDGTFDVLGSDQAVIANQYAFPGDYSCVVRVHGADGFAYDAATDFSIINPANLPPGAMLNITPDSGPAPLLVHLDGAGSTDEGYIRRYEWDLDGDLAYETDSGATPDLFINFGDKGLHLVRLRVTDNDYATDEVTEFFTLTNGWRQATIDASVDIDPRGPLCGAVVGAAGNEKAAVAYTDWAAHNLYYAQALDDYGTQWTSPIEPVSNSADVGYGLAMARTPGNRAMIAYGKNNNPGGNYDGDLMLVEGNSNDGSMWKAPLTVCAGQNIGLCSSLLFAGGNPCIFSVSDHEIQGAGKIQYFRGLDAHGSSFAPPVTVFDIYSSVSQLSSLLTSGGLPLAVASFGSRYANTDPHGIGIFNATDALGLGWNPPVEVSADVSMSCSAQLVAGQPAFAAGTQNDWERTWFARASDAGGLSWPASPALISPPGQGGSASLAVIGGLPWVAWVSFHGGDLYAMRAADPAANNWDAPVLVYPLNSYQPIPVILGPEDKPVIVVADTEREKVTGFWFEP